VLQHSLARELFDGRDSKYIRFCNPPRVVGLTTVVKVRVPDTLAGVTTGEIVERGPVRRQQRPLQTRVCPHRVDVLRKHRRAGASAGRGRHHGDRILIVRSRKNLPRCPVRSGTSAGSGVVFPSPRCRSSGGNRRTCRHVYDACWPMSTRSPRTRSLGRYSGGVTLLGRRAGPEGPHCIVVTAPKVPPPTPSLIVRPRPSAGKSSFSAPHWSASARLTTVPPEPSSWPSSADRPRANIRVHRRRTVQRGRRRGMFRATPTCSEPLLDKSHQSSPATATENEMTPQPPGSIVRRPCDSSNPCATQVRSECLTRNRHRRTCIKGTSHHRDRLRRRVVRSRSRRSRPAHRPQGGRPSGPPPRSERSVTESAWTNRRPGRRAPGERSQQRWAVNHRTKPRAASSARRHGAHQNPPHIPPTPNLRELYIQGSKHGIVQSCSTPPHPRGDRLRPCPKQDSNHWNGPVDQFLAGGIALMMTLLAVVVAFTRWETLNAPGRPPHDDIGRLNPAVVE